MSTSSPFNAVINCVQAARLAEVTQHLASAGAEVATLDGTTITDKDSLLAECGRAIFDGRSVANWAQLADLLGAATLSAAPGSQRAIVWIAADTMLQGGLEDLLTANDVFLKTARAATPRGVRFRVFLLGTGPNFRAA